MRGYRGGGGEGRGGGVGEGGGGRAGGGAPKQYDEMTGIVRRY